MKATDIGYLAGLSQIIQRWGKGCRTLHCLQLAGVFLAVGALPIQNVIAAQDTNHVFNVKKFGAHGDGKTLDTTPIQLAIDAAGKAGGGVVLLPPGTYLSGSLEIKSHVELRVETNATLLGSTSHLDYKRLENPKFAYALLLADGCKDISLSGGGTIDGQGRALAKDIFESEEWQAQLTAHLPALRAEAKRERESANEQMESLGAPHPSFESTLTDPFGLARLDGAQRPFLIAFRNCQDVKISGVTLRSPCCYVQNYLSCSNLEIEGIKVDASAYWNNDGMDISDCRNVKICNCDVNSDDDAICLKSERGGKGCWDVDISDCSVSRSSGSMLKLGTASFGGFHKIRARNLTGSDTLRCAIDLESVDGGELDDVVIEHVRATNTGAAIFLRLGNRNRPGPVGQLENVIIRDVKVEVPAGKPDAAYELAGPPMRVPHNIIPSSIVGLPGHPVQNVLLEDIEISYPGGGNRAIAQIPLNALQTVPEEAAAYPKFIMFGELPAWAFYIRHANGIHFQNVRFSFEQADFRPALVIDDAGELNFEKVMVASASEKPVMAFEQVHKAALDIHFPPGFEAVRINPDCEGITGLPAVSSAGY